MYRLPFPRMPSGKRARQQRQQAAAATAPPPVRSKGVGGARGRQASPRALAIAGGVVLLSVIAIVLGVVLTGGSNGGGGGGIVSSQDLEGLPSTGSQSWANALPGAAEANNLFKGIPQNGLVLGNPKAKTEMEMFIDVQCPICQDYEVNHLPTVVNKYIKTGKVQLRLKPWAFISDQSFTGRLGSIDHCALLNGRMLNQSRFYLTGFDSEAADFYLLINATKELDLSVGAISAKITGPIDASAIFAAEWIGNKAFGAELWLSHIVSSDARSSTARTNLSSRAKPSNFSVSPTRAASSDRRNTSSDSS